MAIYDSDYLRDNIVHTTSDTVAAPPPGAGDGTGGIPTGTTAPWLWDPTAAVWYKTVDPGTIRTTNVVLKIDGELDGGNFNDSGPNGYDGTMYGAAQQYDGILGNAIKLDGETSYVEHSAALSVTGELTISTWFWYHPSGADQSICNKFFADATTFLAQFDVKVLNTDKVTFAVFDDDTSYVQYRTVGSLRSHEWNHILCKFNPVGPTMTIKINNVDQSLTDISLGTYVATPAETTIPFRIGMRDGAY